MKPTRNWRIFLSPLGAGFTLLCFFLPWVNVTCTGVRRTLTGAHLGGVLWVAVAAALLILAVFVVLRAWRWFRWARSIMIFAAGVGLAALVAKYFEHSPRILGILHPKNFGLAVQFGMIGTPLGLLIALAGALLLRPSGRIGSESLSSHSREGKVSHPPAGEDSDRQLCRGK